MTNLKILTPPVGTVLPVSEFAEHVRVGSADVTEETPELERALKAAANMLERRLSLALVSQQWVWTPKSWTTTTIPLRPVQSIDEIAIVNMQGVETVWNSDYWRLDDNGILPFGMLPTIPYKGHAKVTFTAGYDAVPEALLQATLLLGAYLYEYRNSSALTQMPYQVESLIAPFKSIRVGGAVCR